MLRHLAHGQDLSPTEFALSVHNAAAGVHSIAQSNRSASTTIVAGAETFAYGLLEAADQWLIDASHPVLFVYSDEPVPSEYRVFVPMSEQAHALALLLSEDALATVRMKRVTAPSGRSDAAEMPSLTFLRGLLGQGRDTVWRGERCAWHWEIDPRSVY
jgi:hypothetical protein